MVLLGKNSAENPAEEAVPYLEAVVLLGKIGEEAVEAVPYSGGCGTAREE